MRNRSDSFQGAAVATDVGCTHEIVAYLGGLSVGGRWTQEHQAAYAMLLPESTEYEWHSPHFEN